MDDPPEPDGLRVRALRTLRRFDGEASVEELAMAMGIDDETSRGTLSASLKRAIKAGEVLVTGGRMSRRYRTAPNWSPPAPRRAPPSPANDASLDSDELEFEFVAT